jgi:hypothetical protein
MKTWQSRRRGHIANWWKSLSPQQGAAILSARRDAADARRMALPAPLYPPERRPGQFAGYIEIHDAINGWTRRFELRVPSDTEDRRARVDQRTLMVGAEPSVTGGWHALFRHMVAKLLPRPHSLRAWATMQADDDETRN